METLTYEAVLLNPDLLDRMRRDARRERSEAVHRLILEALRARRSRPAGRALQTSTCG